MANDLQEMAENQAQTALSSYSPPETLSRILADQTEGYFGKDGQYETREKSWSLPANTSQQERDDASAFLPIAQQSCRTASATDARKWLTTLGTLVAGNMPVQDARAKLTAYVGLLEMPVGMMTREALDRAGRRFKWFPTYSELAEFVDSEKAALSRNLSRVRAIAGQGEPSKSFWHKANFLKGGDE